MIHEFAIDPGVVASWYDPDTYRYFKGKFGLGCPRVLAMFPEKKWRRRVLEAFQASFAGDAAKRDDAWKHLDALVMHLEREATRRRGAVDVAQPWLHAAELEHARRPFHAVVSASNPREHRDVLVARNVDDETPRWSEKCGPVKRTAAALGAALAPVLRCAREVRLVDPYFDASKPRWVKPLARILELLSDRRAPDEGAAIELHTSVERARDKDPLSEDEADRVARHILRTCKERLPTCLPEGSAVTVFVWSELGGGEQFHNRYVLTDVGGVFLGAGLDAADGRSATDNIAVLPRDQYVDCWGRFGRNASVFKARGSPELVRAAPMTRGDRR